MINNIQYEGNVKIVLWKNNKIYSSHIIKNSGTQDLFHGIALALIQSPDSRLLPNYIAVGTDTNETTDDQTYLLGELVRVRIVDTDVHENMSDAAIPKKDGYQAIFRAVIPSNSLSSSAIVNELGLYGTSEGNTLLARVKLDSPITVQIGLSLSIEWTMIIRNKNK